MAYLTSFKSSMPCQHWWPSKRRRRVGVSSFYCGPKIGIHSLLVHLSPVWKELCVEKTLTKEIFKSSLFERLRKAVNNAHFVVSGVNESKSSSSNSHLLEEQQDRLSNSMDDLFYQTAKEFKSFFSGLRRCKRRCASKSPPNTVEIPPKSYSLEGAQDAGLLQIF